MQEEPMKRMMIMILVVAASAAAAGAADFDLPHGKWWENDRVVEKIGLTTEQQQTISALVFDHARRMIDLNAGVKKAELDLADLVDRDDFNPAAVRKAFASFQAARQKLENERFEMLLAVRGNLTAVQWNQLLEIRRFLERQRENRRPGEVPPGRRPPQGSADRGGRQPVDGGWQ
jgi:Spy/CpxP family protein refolding chaperone